MSFLGYLFGSMLLLVAIFALLIYLVGVGNMAAGIVLGALSVVLVFALAQAMLLIASWVTARREQSAFIANAKENMGIMMGMQRVQNQQHTLMQRQALAALPRGEIVDSDALIFDSQALSDLDEEVGQSA